MSETPGDIPSGNGESTIGGASGILGVNSLQRAIDTFDKAVTTLSGIVGTLKGGTSSYQAGQNASSGWNQFSNWMTGGTSGNGGNATFGGTPFNPSTGGGGLGGLINGTPGMSGGAHAMPGPATTGGVSGVLGSLFGSNGQHAAPGNGMGKAMFAFGAASSAASAVHAATGMSKSAYMTTAMTMASTAQVMSTGQSVNAPALFKNGGQVAFNGVDQATGLMTTFQTSGYAANTAGFRQQAANAGQIGINNPMMSSAQSSSINASFHGPQGIVGLHQVGITTVKPGGQTMSVTQIANQILNQIDPGQNVRTPQQAAELTSDQNSPLNLTLGNWVSSGLITGDQVQAIKDSITSILKARQHGVNPTQLNQLLNQAYNNPTGSAAAKLKSMQIDNSAIQSNKTLDSAKRGNMEQGLTGFEKGVTDSTAALTKFTDVLNAIEQNTGISFLSGLYRGGTANGKLGGALAMAPMLGGASLGGLGEVSRLAMGGASSLLGHLGIGGPTDARMSVTSGGTAGKAGSGNGGQSKTGGGSGSGSSGGGGGGSSAGSAHMIWPVGHAPITEAYGVKNSAYAAGHHTGVDFGVPVGTPIHAAASGTVVNAGWGGDYGNYIVVDLHNGLWTLYGHCSRLVVHDGMQVRQGQIIAYSGDTGNATGPHLHFEVRKGANRYGMDVNPMPYLGGASMPAANGNSGSSSTAGSAGSSTGAGSSTNLGSGTSYSMLDMGGGGGGGQAYGAGMSELDVLGSAPSAMGGGGGGVMMVPTSTSGGGGGGGTGIGSPGPGANSPHPGGPSSGPGVQGGFGGTQSGGTPSAGGNRGLGMQIASHYGWGSGAEWNALDKLWTQESGWRTTATNPHSGAYGIAQALPPSKYNSVAPDWKVNPATQIEWGLMYIKNRYGNPLKAWAHEVADNWYDKGAWDIPKDQRAMVHKGEMILQAPAARQIREILMNGNPYGAMGNQAPGASLVFAENSIRIDIHAQGQTSAATGRALAKEFVDTVMTDKRIKQLQGG